MSERPDGGYDCMGGCQRRDIESSQGTRSGPFCDGEKPERFALGKHASPQLGKYLHVTQLALILQSFCTELIQEEGHAHFVGFILQIQRVPNPPLNIELPCASCEIMALQAVTRRRGVRSTQGITPAEKERRHCSCCVKCEMNNMDPGTPCGGMGPITSYMGPIPHDGKGMDNIRS